MKSVLFDVMLTVREVVFVATLLCTKPSDHVMVHGAVPVSVTGMVIGPGPQIESVAGMFADGGLLIGIDLDDELLQVPLLTVRLSAVVPVVPEVNVMFAVPAPAVIVPFVIDQLYVPAPAGAEALYD
jgi:hypothetical protein